MDKSRTVELMLCSNGNESFCPSGKTRSERRAGRSRETRRIGDLMFDLLYYCIIVLFIYITVLVLSKMPHEAQYAWCTLDVSKDQLWNLASVAPHLLYNTIDVPRIYTDWPNNTQYCPVYQSPPPQLTHLCNTHTHTHTHTHTPF